MSSEPNLKKAETRLPYLPDLNDEEIIQQQLHTARKLGLEHFFSDPMKSGGSGPELAIIPAGMFQMGSPEKEFGHVPAEAPLHYVTLQQPFAIGRYAITANEFDRFRKATGWFLRPELLWAKGRQPVMNVRQADVKPFLDWLNEETGQQYRLPTEAEWEYATRAGSTTPFHFGNSVSCKEVNFDPVQPYDESRDKRRWFLPRCIPLASSIEVGSKPANLWGLHEVHGNVWEHTCSPWSHSHLDSNRDGSASKRNLSRWYVTRGGSWFDPAIKARSAARMKRLYDEMDTNLGFRVVREL